MEIAGGIGVCVMMGRIASEENRSAIIWFCITFLLCFASVLLPIPYLRFLIAGGISFAAILPQNVNAPVTWRVAAYSANRPDG